jgi:hypothetical protein
MTDPLGRYWNQPSRDLILVDETHAVMTAHTFQQLSEYSATIPSGVYPGKMWRRLDGAHDRKCPMDGCRWLLCWYGDDIGGKCGICFREVLLA